MEELREEAQEYYTACSAEVRAMAFKLFNRMDTDGDSNINVSEMASFLKGNKIISRKLTAKELVFAIDENGNGKLDFNEFITLFYFLFACATCDACGTKLMGQRRLTCITCYTEGADDSFDLCSSCFSSNTYAHVHRSEDGSFVDFSALMLHLASNNTNQVEYGTETKSSEKRSVSSRLTSPEALKKLERVHKVTQVSLEVVQHMASAGCNIM